MNELIKSERELIETTLNTQTPSSIARVLISYSKYLNYPKELILTSMVGMLFIFAFGIGLLFNLHYISSGIMFALFFLIPFLAILKIKRISREHFISIQSEKEIDSDQYRNIQEIKSKLPQISTYLEKREHKHFLSEQDFAMISIKYAELLHAEYKKSYAAQHTKLVNDVLGTPSCQ